MDPDDAVALLAELTRLDAPPGYEGPVRAWLQARLPAGYTARTDGLGNLLVLPDGAAAPRGLVVAPLDEAGFMAQPGPAAGWVRLSPLGPAPLPGPAAARVRFADGTRGVLTPDPAVPTPKAWADWLCDVAPATVPTGQTAVWDTAPRPQGSRLLGKAAGSRAALLAAYLALHAARPHCPVAWVFASREHVPGHGAAPAAYGLQPAWAVRVVPALAGDRPGQRVPGLTVGRGPGLRRREWGRVADPRLTAWLERAFATHPWPYQPEVPADREPSWASLPLVAAGLPTATLSIPTRNLHAAHAAVDIGDVLAAAHGLQAALESNCDPLG